MKELHDFLKQINIKTNRYEKHGKVYFVNDSLNKYVVKEEKEDSSDIYEYLNTRNFNYYPEVLAKNDKYELTKYIKSKEYPEEQKMHDLINVISLLHSKTSFYKEIEEDYFKKIYEDIIGNIEYLKNYYSDLIEMIEKETYMRPSFYLLARNITLFFNCLELSKSLNEKWYQMIKDKNKMRFVVIHNNLSLDHYIKEESDYLISWNKSKIGLAIFDLYKLYKHHALDFDFEFLLNEYEKKYPLLEEERILLKTLIVIPEKLEINEEFENCINYTKNIDTLYKTYKLVKSYKEEEK